MVEGFPYWPGPVLEYLEGGKVQILFLAEEQLATVSRDKVAAFTEENLQKFIKMIPRGKGSYSRERL
jgi:hypothetical protein